MSKLRCVNAALCKPCSANKLLYLKVSVCKGVRVCVCVRKAFVCVCVCVSVLLCIKDALFRRFSV